MRICEIRQPTTLQRPGRPFYAWSKLPERGTQVECTVSSKSEGQFHAVAAKGEDGSLAVLVARYSASNDVTDTGMTVLRIPYYDVANSGPPSHEVWMGVCRIYDINSRKVDTDFRCHGRGPRGKMPAVGA